jgi:hypothetical protein
MTVTNIDFTISHYRELCVLAVKNYSIASYRDIPFGERFILWRHDIDISLNRALVLAKTERELGIKATYFLNPHSEFYNIAEAGQYKIIKEIIKLGHDIGLHFDSSFFGDISEEDLNRFVRLEAKYLKLLFNAKPAAFSFHNPVANTLKFEADTYGGVINCYSKRLKTEVPYCSDSNGYWRFRRLHDVLSDAVDPCLQVLTHPGWWQDKPMPPRQRIFRSVLGRASGIVRTYDEALQQHGRLNQTGKAEVLYVLKDPLPRRFQICDYLWNQGEFEALFVELWRIHEEQINSICKAFMRKEWRMPAAEVNTLFDSDGVSVDGWRLFEALFGVKWQDACGFSEDEHKLWVKVRNQIMHARSSIAPAELEQGCVYLCDVLQKIAEWGLKQPFSYNGLAHLGSIGLPTMKTAEGTLEENLSDRLDELPKHLVKQWRDFVSKLSDSH